MLVPAEASLYCGCWPRLEVDYGTIVLWHDKYGTIVLWIPSQHEFEIRQVVHKQVLEFGSHVLAMRWVVIRDSCGHRKWWLCGAKRPKKTNIIALSCSVTHSLQVCFYTPIACVLHGVHMSFMCTRQFTTWFQKSSFLRTLSRSYDDDTEVWTKVVDWVSVGLKVI